MGRYDPDAEFDKIMRDEKRWNAFKRIAGDFSAEERAALFHDTAARVYRL